MARIAIQPDAHHPYHERWLSQLAARGHRGNLVDVHAPDFLARIRDFDGLLWWCPPRPRAREVAKRLLAALDHVSSVMVYPDRDSGWHFDDKLAQHYLLQAAGIPMPRTHVFWREAEARAFVREAAYPFVVKLSSGFRSRNVALVRDRREAERWLRRQFPGRFRRLLHAEERGYLLAQEFVPGNAWDTRVTVVGDRAWASRRVNRPGDFRASGSGVLLFEPSEIAQDALDLARRAARLLGSPTLAVDVVRGTDGQPLVLEVSYFFEFTGMRDNPGYWQGETFVPGRVIIEDFVLDDFLARLQRSTASRQQ
ncbi:MAG TPA: hypothetical protein VF618_04070 [Thermoanaerobaculia bacterium]